MHFSLCSALGRTFYPFITIPRPIPGYLIAAATTVGRTKHIQNCSSIRQRGDRNISTAATGIFSKPPRSDALPYVPRDLPLGINLPSLSSRGQIDAWISLLDQLFTSDLRANEVQGEDRLFSSQELVDILRVARKIANFDLLEHLGVKLNRWNAVFWILERILPNEELDSHVESPPSLFPFLRDKLSPLDILTTSAICFERPPSDRGFTDSSLDELTSDVLFSRPLKENASNIVVRDLALREVWQSLGSMILSAAELSPGDSSAVMSNVYQILASLHHAGFIPDNIYTHSPSLSPWVLQRPPTLHILSSRILSTLSDAVWRAQEKHAAEAAAASSEHVYRWFEIPGARYRLRLRELGPEVWLELVLWSCVEGGFLPESAWILNKLRNSRKQGSRWSVVSWDSLRKSGVEKKSTTPRIDLERAKSRWNGLFGRVEGYSVDRPIVEMGDRTISSEVVVATIDGLIHTMQTSVGTRGLPSGLIYDHLWQMKDILERDGCELGPNSWNSIIVRLLQTQGIDPEQDPAALERLFDFAPTFFPNLSVGQGLKDLEFAAFPPPSTLDQSALTIGLLHRALDAHVCSGNVSGALRIFSRLQGYVDRNKQKSISQFIEELKQHSTADSDNELSSILDSDMIKGFPGFFAQIPSQILANFLDLTTETKVFSVGRWLLYATDPDGPMISRQAFPVHSLTPSLIRFATKTTDNPLLEMILHELDPPYTDEVLRALFHAHVHFSDWTAATALVDHYSRISKLKFQLSDIAELLREILRLEYFSKTILDDSDIHANNESLGKVQGLVRHILTKESLFDMIGEFSPQRIRARVLLTIFSDYSSSLGGFKIDNLNTSYRTKLPLHAFNIFLQGVVDYQGSLAGQTLWNTWVDKVEDMTDKFHEDSGIMRLPSQQKGLGMPFEEAKRNDFELSLHNSVPPNISSLRIIERGAMLELSEGVPINSIDKKINPRRLPREESMQVLHWAAVMLRKMGLSEKEIGRELEGFLKK
ncbi:MAG: hypothetical protein M1834_000681 [Cirrosporium novae-zelandiae]|nr:MAG: hypothetical protein M1834_000681 [Cirrosporium novae-zelandiae]